MMFFFSIIAFALVPAQAAPAEHVVPPVSAVANFSKPFTPTAGPVNLVVPLSGGLAQLVTPTAGPVNVVVPLSGGLAQLATPTAQPTTTTVKPRKTKSKHAPQPSNHFDIMPKHHSSRPQPSIKQRPTHHPKPTHGNQSRHTSHSQPKPTSHPQATPSTSHGVPHHVWTDHKTNTTAPAHTGAPKSTHHAFPPHHQQGETVRGPPHGLAMPFDKFNTRPHRFETRFPSPPLFTRTRPHHVVEPEKTAGTGPVTTKPSQAVATH